MYLCVGLLSMNIYSIHVSTTKSNLLQLFGKSLTTYYKIKTYSLSGLVTLIWRRTLWYKNWINKAFIGM
jgi:hypothetical protein